jgi:hypothetical protein
MCIPPVVFNLQGRMLVHIGINEAFARPVKPDGGINHRRELPLRELLISDVRRTEPTLSRRSLESRESRVSRLSHDSGQS